MSELQGLRLVAVWSSDPLRVHRERAYYEEEHNVGQPTGTNEIQEQQSLDSYGRGIGICEFWIKMVSIA